MGADVTVKGLLGLETGDGGGLGKKDGWLALRGETTITSLELAPAEKKKKQQQHLASDHSLTNTDGLICCRLPEAQVSLIFPNASHFKPDGQERQCVDMFHDYITIHGLN